ncbi:VWA domain-containing protein [Ferruginibacter lapsinanis]|uniref:vWA domain-containing protein n=1 Tax=Ferruginibacter lapsinanis TaxID=563172 RepID=UPI001E58879A|nr:VWA domain-containing protein [Ferruginibacter lapsinanis]UEG48558.1 VWA domain-containing protein [Ferruginibacter lapsinanis]
MKRTILYILAIFFANSLSAQYYLRGEIKDKSGQPIQNVKMILRSTHLTYYAGNSGGFGISTDFLYDSLTVIHEGYETQTVGIKSDVYQEIVMKKLNANDNKNRQKLISITKDFNQTSKYKWFFGDESYFSLVENAVVDAEKYPNTGFSLNINKASYSNIRRFINMKSSVPPDAVRVEELLNYFNLHYVEPEKDQVFRVESQISECPWNIKNNLLYLNISARKINMDKVPPSNLVFLIDASGSMDMPNRLPLVKAAFQMLVKNLRTIDTVSIVKYGGPVQVWLQPTSGGQKEKIIQSIEELTADGDTPGESAIRLAYRIAKSTFIKGGTNRVILATDGDFNVGETTEEALEDLIVKERQSGLYLTCLGVGMGNFKDSKLETLAKKGNGNYAYLDDIQEAEKVLVKEVTQTFYTVADNVFLNVQFNPALVSEYRLIGFDNKRDAVADSTGELEGGEIGSGNSVMAIFEYKSAINKINEFPTSGAVAQVVLSYNTSPDKTRKEVRFDCRQNYLPFNSIDKELQFGTALAMFGMKLRQSKNLGIADWNDIESIATTSANPENYLQRDFIKLLKEARKFYTKKRKKGYD